ncbi:MAG: hypothetical protein Q7T76_08565 [Ferruginibacter sp.]|nr:hypothetical protein [Ferruginibacter sp.]
MAKRSSFFSGLAGSIALTVFHEILRKTVSNAPRMDKLGKQGLTKVLSAVGSDKPSSDNLQKITLGGDLMGNAGYYAMVGIKPGYSLVTGAVLGLAAGIGAVALPEKMGLNESYSNATTKTKVLTVLLYVTGGLVAGAVHRMFENRETTTPKNLKRKSREIVHRLV